MITKQNNEIYSTTNKYVHIIGTDSYFKRGLGIGLSVDQCEEVDEITKIIDKKSYEDKVNDLIRSRYSLSEELAILRQKDEKPDEYSAYFAFCEQCKTEAKAWIAEHPDGELPPLPQPEDVSETTNEGTAI